MLNLHGKDTNSYHLDELQVLFSNRFPHLAKEFRHIL